MRHCWMERLEADGARSWLDWIIADPERCRLVAEAEDWPPDPTGGHDTCMREDGHAGPHEFVPISEIVVRFR